jgi:hypothetical protein
MASMPGYHVSKGPFKYLDQMFDGTNPQAYIDAKTRLAGSLLTAAEQRLGAGTAVVNHFNADWLGNSAGWGHLKPGNALAAGLTAAIKAAQGPQGDAEQHPKPMEFLWVCANEREFHVYYSVTPRQVTVIVFTPLPEHGPGHAHHTTAPLTKPEDIWVVKLEDNFETGPGGANYPGPITPLGTTSAPPGRIIQRQIFRD